MSEYESLKKTGKSSEKNISCTNTSRQNILKKLKKLIKAVSFLEWPLRISACSPTMLKFS